MSDETKPADLWDRTVAWADKNRTISGALIGGAAGTIVPGFGTVIGAVVGAGIGFASSKEKISQADRKLAQNTTDSGSGRPAKRAGPGH
jgi:uncharacterized membrane protein